MNTDDIRELLGRLVEIHKLTSKQVDYSKEDRKRAIWYLQGCVISTSYAVLEMYEKGQAVPASHEWRFVNEVRDLILMFDIIKEDDRRIKAWYKGKIVERRKNEHHEIVSKPPFPTDYMKMEREIRSKLSNELSSFIHPSIKVARYNVYPVRGTEIFDYQWKTLKNFSEILIIVRTSVICSIHALSLPLRTLNQPQDILQELNQLYDKAEKIGQ